MKLLGLVRYTPRIFFDERGFFLESYNQPLYQKLGVEVSFVQDNLSFSKRGTVRGLHFQSQPGQAKLISCLEGRIWDVAVDIRPDSPTFGAWEGIFLDSEAREQFFIPSGFAHGFCVLSETALVQYKVSSVYNPVTECSIRWNDPTLAIEWPVIYPILSPRDQTNPLFTEVFRDALAARR